MLQFFRRHRYMCTRSWDFASGGPRGRPSYARDAAGAQGLRCARNSAPSRMRNRCWATGKPRGVYRDFGLCRNQLRARAHKGELPGLVKSSW